MTIAPTFAAGAAYAGCLWLLAAFVASRRELVLGPLPCWIILLCGSAAVCVAAFLPPDAAILAGTSLIGAIVCALVDARTGFIFDALSLTMMLVACVVGIFDGRFPDGALAAALVGGTLGALHLVTRRRGIGLGDVKLSSAIALSYGLASAAVAIGSAFILGAVYAGVMIGLGRAKRSDAMRFGPFIAGGAAVGLTVSVFGWRW